MSNVVGDWNAAAPSLIDISKTHNKRIVAHWELSKENISSVVADGKLAMMCSVFVLIFN